MNEEEQQYPPGQQARFDTAKKYLAESNLQALYQLYVEAENDVKTIADGLAVMVKYGKMGLARNESESSIQAIKEVALSSNRLAEAVIGSREDDIDAEFMRRSRAQRGKFRPLREILSELGGQGSGGRVKQTPSATQKTKKKGKLAPR